MVHFSCIMHHLVTVLFQEIECPSNWPSDSESRFLLPHTEISLNTSTVTFYGLLTGGCRRVHDWCVRLKDLGRYIMPIHIREYWVTYADVIERALTSCWRIAMLYAVQYCNMLQEYKMVVTALSMALRSAVSQRKYRLLYPSRYTGTISRFVIL